MKKKILVVGSSAKDKGGIVTVIKNISNSFIAEKYNLERIETYITGSKLKRLSIYLKGLIIFFYKITIKRPDLIHIHMSYKGSFYRKSIMILLAKVFKIPVFIHIHGSSFKDFYNNLDDTTKKFCDFTLNKADQVIVLSQQWKEFFSTFIDPQKVFVLYNGVQISNHRKSYDNEDVTPTCLFLGRLGERKGVYTLLESIRVLKEKNVKVKFILAGDGEIDTVNKIIKEHQLKDMVETVGWINGEEKNSLLRSSDILVLPSYNEGLPMAILEAMDYGLGIVSTRVGGIPEVIKDNENGFLIEPGDIEGLTNSLHTLIKDNDLIKSVGVNNNIKIKNQFDLNILLKDLDKLYEQAINEN